MANNLTFNEQRFNVGDTVRVHQRITEAGKSRIQILEGVIIAINNRESGKSFIVRKIGANGIGVERIFPLNSPAIVKLEMKQAGRVHRAKLFYLRNRIGKAASAIKKRLITTEA